MSEQTLQGPPIPRPVPAGPAEKSRRSSTLELIRSHPWLIGGAGLLLLSTLIVLWAGTRPGYDPYGWLVWGHLTVHFKLDTNGAPSWKPLPFLFTVPFGVVGHYALWLWMVTSVAISLSGVVFAWRIASRLTGAAPGQRHAAHAAGLFAALALLGIANYTHFILSAQSDTMIVSLCLAAIDCLLSGRPRWAFWLWILASMGRPEVWPFLGLYSLWAWRELPAMRRQIVVGLVLIPVFWFGIPALTAKSAFVAGQLAQNSPRELHSNRFFGTLHRFLDLDPAPILLAALLAIGWAFRRRDRPVQLLAAGTIAWVLIEGAFALHGWPAVPRYLFEPAAIACVLAGVFVGRVILDLPRLIAATSPRLSPGVANLGSALVLVVLVGSLIPAARSHLDTERHDLTHERARAQEIDRLSGVVARLGTTRILACGQPNIPIEYQSVLAWYMGVKIGELYYNKNYEALHPHPIVNIYPLRRGWKVFPSHMITAAQRARCGGLILRTST